MPGEAKDVLSRVKHGPGGRECGVCWRASWRRDKEFSARRGRG